MSTNDDRRGARAMRLVRVRKDEASARALYELLKTRTHTISHRRLPDYDAHKRFVFSHPYRAWHFIEVNGEYVGTIYLLRSNNIGVSIREPYEGYFGEAIEAVQSRYRPLPAIPSIRPGHFAINVSPSDTALANAVQRLGAELAQVTYVLRAGDD